MAKASASSATPAPPTTPPPSSAECRETLAGLNDQHSKLVARGTEIADERTRVAGIAIIDHDATAQKTLEGLGAESTAVAIQVSDLQAAIKEGEARLRAALARDAAAAEVVVARRVSQIISERQGFAVKAAKLLAEFNDTYAALIELGNEMRRLTDRATSMNHESMILRAAQTMSRCQLVKKGLLSSEPQPQEALRAELFVLLEHLDKAADLWSARIIQGDGEGEQQQQRNAA